MGAEKMELVLINPEENGFLQHIDWNKEEIKSKVMEITEGYRNVVYTDDTMKLAKEDRAELNRLKKAIEDRRKMVKKKLLEPYEVFEAEVKEVLALIEEPVSLIDEQVKAYEAQKKDEKKQQLLDFFQENVDDVAHLLSFEKVFEDRYLHANVSLNKAKGLILEKIERVKSDIKTIDVMCNEKYKVNAMDVYTKTLSISDALAEQTRLMELERKMEEERKRRDEAEAARRAEAERRKEQARLAEEARLEEEARRAEEARIAEEARLKAELEAQETVTESAETVIESADSVIKTEENVSESSENVQISNENAQIPAETVSEPEKVVVPPVQEDAKRYKASFTVVGTKAQIMALKQYMIDNNIEFGKVGK